MAFRLLGTALTAAALLCVTGCDQVSEGFDKGFNESFAKSMKEGCMKTGSQAAGAAMAESYCTCVVNELSPLPVKEKMDLKPDSPATVAAAQKCAAEHIQAPS